jgi:IS1 family transposase
MIGLLRLFFSLLASPFKSKSQLEAENAALRHQLIVLRRKVQGQVRSRRMVAGSLSSCIAGFHQS